MDSPDVKGKQCAELPPDLDVIHEHGFLGVEERNEIWTYLTSDAVLWNRPKYASERFGKMCETPCWTTVQGGLEGANHFEPIAPVLRKLQARLEERLGTSFNVVLLRLYFGSDTIAYHTDAREFLGKSCFVASVSLGETRRLDMKRVEGELWPAIGDAKREDGDEKEKEPAPKKARPEVVSFDLADGDLFVMCGETQQHFYHAVPPQPRITKPRFNLNFRRIVFSAGQDVAMRGHDTYYKYCVTGDDPLTWRERAKKFAQIKPVSIADFFNKRK